MAAALAAGLLAACGPAEQDAATKPRTATSPARSGPDPALVSWAGRYCAAVKDIQLSVYTLPKGYELKSAADLSKAAAGLRKLDRTLAITITRLQKLPKVAAPAQQANARAGGELAFYRKLRGKVTEYRLLLPRGGLDYARAALELAGVDLLTHVPAVATDRIPGLRQAMRANKGCELVG